MPRDASSGWHLGWWSPTTPGHDPADVIDPALHGPLLAAAANGLPLDPLGRSRLESLRALGLTGIDLRPRFPVVTADDAVDVSAAAARLGGSIARLLAGEWSRIEGLHHPLTSAGRGAGPDGSGSEPPLPGLDPRPAAERQRWSGWRGETGFVIVGGLLLGMAVRRLLRRQGLTSPAFGGALAWLVEGGEGAAGRWFARATEIPGRGRLVRFGDPSAPAWLAAAAEPEAAPAVPAVHEADLLRLVDSLAGPIARLVTEAVPEFDKARATPPDEDAGAALAWAYTLAADAALAALAERGLVEIPADGVAAIRAADETLTSS
jgi:hypothetical protein